MPINSTHRMDAIRPGIVCLPGIVILAAGPIIDVAQTITPGITATRTGTGLYTLTFNDGPTVGFVTVAVNEIIDTTGKDPLIGSFLGGSTFQAGSTSVSFEASTVGGVLTDPEVGGGFTYFLTRFNTAVQ